MPRDEILEGFGVSPALSRPVVEGTEVALALVPLYGFPSGPCRRLQWSVSPSPCRKAYGLHFLDISRARLPSLSRFEPDHVHQNRGLAGRRLVR